MSFFPIEYETYETLKAMNARGNETASKILGIVFSDCVPCIIAIETSLWVLGWSFDKIIDNIPHETRANVGEQAHAVPSDPDYDEKLKNAADELNDIAQESTGDKKILVETMEKAIEKEFLAGQTRELTPIEKLLQLKSQHPIAIGEPIQYMKVGMLRYPQREVQKNLYPGRVTPKNKIQNPTFGRAGF